MADIETPEQFVEFCDGLDDYDGIVSAIRARDAAVRREALASAAHLVAGMRSEVDNAKAHLAWRAAGSKGMHVPFHGDFAGVPTSALHRLEWWLRELADALAGGSDG